MELSITKERLLASLQKVQGVVEKKQTMPILAYCLLECKDNKLYISATDLEVGMRISTECKTIKEGKTTVSARNFFDIVRELSDNSEIHIKLNSNNWVCITASKSNFNLVALPAEDFPNINKTEDGKTFKFNGSVLSEMIDKTIFSVSNDETRYFLNGLYIESVLENSEKKLRIVSTDGYRLSIINRNIEKDDDVDIEKGIIIPRKGVNEIRKILDQKNNNQKVMFHVSQNILNLENKDIFLSVRLINGDFPDYRKVVPANNDKTVTLPKEHFVAALKRASLVANNRSKSVTFNINSNKLQMQSNNPDLGNAHEEVEISYDSDKEITIGFNAKYFLDVLDVIDSDTIAMKFNDSLSPCIVNDNKDEDYQAIIMPMRI